MMSCTSCAMINTPLFANLQLWMAQYRFGGGWPMILLAPIAAFISAYLIIVGQIPGLVDLTEVTIQFCCVVLFAVWVFRNDISATLTTLMGLCGKTSSSSASESPQLVKGGGETDQLTQVVSAQ